MYTIKNTEEESRRLSQQALGLYGGPSFVEPFIKNGIQVLDMGCGTGVIVNHFAQQFPATQFTACDIDLTRIDPQIQKNIPKNLEFKKANIFSLPFEDNTFDLTYCRFILFHLPDPKSAVRELARVTKKQGKVVACEGMHDAVWIKPVRPMFERMLQAWIEIMKDLGQDAFLGSSLNTIFYEAGLREIQVEIRSDSYSGTNPLYETYVKNWYQLLLSVRETLGNRFDDSDFEQLKLEMETVQPHDYFLELCATAVGVKT